MKKKNIVVDKIPEEYMIKSLGSGVSAECFLTSEGKVFKKYHDENNRWIYNSHKNKERYESRVFVFPEVYVFKGSVSPENFIGYMMEYVKGFKYSELEKLSYQSGGRALMANFLQITDEKVTESLNIHTEPEYYMSEQQIVDLIKTGSLDAFLDCLDYAPVGIIDLLKRYAVSLPMTDTQKRRALQEKTGFDVTKAIEMVEAEQKDDEVGTTKVKAEETTSSGGRRSTANYKVISKAEEKTE